MSEDWCFSDLDRSMAEALRDFLPRKLYDAHAHLYRAQDLRQKGVPLVDAGPSTVNLNVWRHSLEEHLGTERLAGGLFFPFPTRDGDIQAQNRFLIDEIEKDEGSRGLILLSPKGSREETEELVSHPQVVGYKPYHCYAPQPTLQAGLDEYIPEWAWESAHRHGLILTVHLVRDRALSDPGNRRTLREKCTQYPNAEVVLAHAGRGFHGPNTCQGVAALRGLENLWFDTSAVCEAGPLLAILREFGPKKLIWGSDFPVSQQRGRCVTLGDTFHWIEPRHTTEAQYSGPDRTASVGQESFRALKEAADIFGLNARDVEDILHNNIQRLLGLSRESSTEDSNLYARAKHRIPGGVQLLSKRPEMMAPGQWPAYFREARGCETWDIDGRHFYDMSTNGIGACLLGFRDTDVTRAVQRRIQLGSMCTLNSPDEVELADRLCTIHPWAERVRLARTGGEIATVAVRIARATTGRDVIAVCGYHGWHDWYLAANLGEDDSLRGHLLPGLEPAGTPEALRGTTVTFTYNRPEEFQKVLDRHGPRLAAVVMEPCRHHDPQPGFLEFVRDETHRCGAMLVFDEITIGWRLCHGGAHKRFGIDPDMAIFAKALGNGHPIAAVIGTREAMHGAHDSFISSTYWTEAVGPAAALATLKKFEQANLPNRIAQIGKRLQETWRDRGQEHGLPVQVDDGHPCLAHFQFEGRQGNQLRTLYTQLMLERGFLAGTSIYPTMAHTDEIVERYRTAIDEVFAELSTALARGTVSQDLKGPEAHSGFRRLL